MKDRITTISAFFLPFKFTVYSSVIVLVTGILAGCSSDEEPETSTFISNEFIDTNPVSNFRVLLQLAGIGVETENWKYDVDLHKINYTTTVDGADIRVSALVMIPQTEEALSLISFHRGTITASDEAPSELRLSDGITSLYSGLASLGMVAVFPDMIGFGSSLEMVHPYYIRDINAQTVRDAIVAAAEFAENQGVNLDGDLYLAGYSQGGYITMAAQRSIEADDINGFDLVATFPAAGAYDVKGLQEYFFTLTTYEQPYYLAYVGLAYEEYRSLDINLSDIFNEPYADRIPDLFDGTLTNTEINEELSHEISELLTADFLEGLEVEERFSVINSLFTENGLLDWTPRVPTYLYHGDADTFIPVQNSIDSREQLLENGADEDDLTLTIFPGEDHGGGTIPYAEDVALKLIELLDE